jgi:hypothetical protein
MSLFGNRVVDRAMTRIMSMVDHPRIAAREATNGQANDLQASR